MDEAGSHLAAALRNGAKECFEDAKETEIVFDIEEGPSLAYKAGRFLRETERESEIDGFRLLMGEVEFPSGHRFHAVIVLCVPDGCEHYGTFFLVPHPEEPENCRWLEQGTPEFDEWRQLAKQADPSVDLDRGYRYRYLDENLRAEDNHVGDDGWSLQ